VQKNADRQTKLLKKKKTNRRKKAKEKNNIAKETIAGKTRLRAKTKKAY
jgi:hypothetical protein